MMVVFVITDLVFLVSATDVADRQAKVDAETITQGDCITSADTCAPVDLGLMAFATKQELVTIYGAINTCMKSLKESTAIATKPIAGRPSSRRCR